MASKHLLFRSEAREKVLRGATAIADAVRVTLEPRSRSVLIERKWGKPIVCNDGVTIAREFALKHADENLGAQMLRDAAERTGDAVGDGVEKMRSGSGNVGIDGASGTSVDLVEAGITGPAKVVRLALEKAVSVAGVLLLTEATMTDVAEPRAETAAAGAEAL